MSTVRRLPNPLRKARTRVTAALHAPAKLARAPARVRVGVLLGVAIAILLIAAAVVVIVRGSEEPGPATGAAAIVPGDALAYVHLSTDPQRPAVKRAVALAGRFPDFPVLSGAVLSRLSRIAGGSGPVDFAADIRPWLGKEAAFALLNTPSATAGSLIVLDVSDRARARDFVTGAGATADGTYDRVELLRYRVGTELAFVHHYLVLGQAPSVRSAIDAATGRSASLQNDSAYRGAAAGEPNDRVLDGYASAAGVRRVLAAQGGLLGAAGALLSQPALNGTSISVSAVTGGARVRVHSALDPAVAQISPSHSVSFAPSLQQVIPSGSMLMLDVSGLDRVAPRVLNAGAAGGVAGQIGPLLARLGAALSSEGVNVSSVLSIFHGETAVAISPHTRTPSLVIVARAPNQSATRDTLAGLEAPLAQLFPTPSTGSGQVPEFNDVQVAGITAHELSLAPGLQLDYALFKKNVVVSTSLDGIDSVIQRRSSVASEKAFDAVLGDRPDHVTSLLFLDFSQLLSLGEQTGLTRSARFQTLRPDLQKVRAIGLTSTSGESDSTAELFIHIP